MKLLVFVTVAVLAVAAIPLQQKLDEIAERAGDAAIIVLPLLEYTGHLIQHAKIVRNFVSNCGNGKEDTKRSHVHILLPPYNRPASCNRGKKGDCESLQITAGDLTIRPKINHNLKAKISEILIKNKEKLAGSIGVILTDVPCHKYVVYPDLNDILNANFTDVAKSLDGFDFHMDLLFLDDDEHQRNHVPCEPVRKHHDNAPKTSHFHVDYVNYGKLADLGTSLCEKDF